MTTSRTGAVFGTAASPIRVQVTGLVLADDEGKVVMCPPFGVAGVGTTSTEVPTPHCMQPVAVTGVDLATLADPQHNSKHRWGNTHIEAMWDGTRLTVRAQRLPTTADRDPSEALPQGVGCPAPAGGWKVGEVQNDPGVQKIQAAVGPGFGALAMGYPHGGPTNDDGTNPSFGLQDIEQVVVVGVTGDVGRATAAIRTVFTGNLCVVHSPTTGTEVDRQSAQLFAAFENKMSQFGVMSTGDRQNPLGSPSTQVDVVVDTPELHRLVTGVAGPPIVVNAWIKPMQ